MTRRKKLLIIARHGDRTPSMPLESQRDFWKQHLAHFDSFPPLPDSISEDDTFGQLTTTGVQQMVDMARCIDSLFKVQDFQVGFFYSTAYQRTLRSAQIVAQTLFDPAVQVHCLDKSIDPLDPWESDPCFRAQVESFKFSNKTEESEDCTVVKRIYPELASCFSWISALDLHRCHVAHCTTTTTTSASSHDVTAIVEKHVVNRYYQLFSDPILLHLAAKRITRGIVSWFEEENRPRVEGELWLDPDADFAFVSCHDMNIIPLQLILGWDPAGWPDYAYFIALERNENEVRIVDSLHVEKRIKWTEVKCKLLFL